MAEQKPKPKQRSEGTKKTPQEQSTKTSNSSRMQTILACSGIISPILVALISVYGVNAARDRDELKTKYEGWRFSEPLYKQIPGDIDFLARGFRADKKVGGQMTIRGPRPDDKLVIEVSKLEANPKSAPDRQIYQIWFNVFGQIGGNEITSFPVGPVPAKANHLVGPMKAWIYEFYLLVEKIEVDYVFLTVARRAIKTGNTFTGSVGPLGSFHAGNQQRPGPILVDSPPLN
jgi:hypothetical protein